MPQLWRITWTKKKEHNSKRRYSSAFYNICERIPKVQNIELMLLADFCRNCLAKWYAAAAKEQGLAVDYEQAREYIYGMPYKDWQALHQTEATPEQLAALEAKIKLKNHE